MNILIVEDEPTDAKLVRVVLAYEGHAITDVGTAEQAVSVIREHKPDLIVLDLALPGMDGLTLARQLKADPETCDIFILAVTVGSTRWSRQEAMKVGCDGYMIKPLATRVLCAQVEEIEQQIG